jgi:hypothetical protein
VSVCVSLCACGGKAPLVDECDANPNVFLLPLIAQQFTTAQDATVVNRKWYMQPELEEAASGSKPPADPRIVSRHGSMAERQKISTPLGVGGLNSVSICPAQRCDTRGTVEIFTQR